MPIQIGDGTGNSFVAKVDSDHRLHGRVVSQGPLEDEGSIRGNAAYFYSTLATGTTDVEVMSIQNDDAKHLHVTRLIISSVVTTTWTAFEVTTGTPGGTVLTYQNPTLASGVANSVTAFGNNVVTGTLSGNNLFGFITLANTNTQIFLEGSLILGTGDKIAFTASADGVVHLTVIGFWSEN